MTIHSITGGPVSPAPQTQRVCPLSISARASALSGDSVAAAPCLGEACMAAVPLTDDQGRQVGHGCSLCLVPQTINGVTAQIAELKLLVQVGLRAQGLIPMPSTPTQHA